MSPEQITFLIILFSAIFLLLGICGCLSFLFIVKFNKKRIEKDRAIAENSKIRQSKTDENTNYFTDGNFQKYKRKFFIATILKSLICGISFGLVAVGVVLLVLKLNAIIINPGCYVLLSVAVALVVGELAFLFVRLTEKKVAKSLDNDYALDERVQTALEFKDKEGFIYKLQRDDADSKIENLPRRRLKFSRIWQYCVIVLISLGLVITSFCIPFKQIDDEEKGPVIDPGNKTPYVLTAYQEAALNELIVNVNESHLTDRLKDSTVYILATLLETLRETETVGEMHEHVFAAIEEVHKIILPVNFYADVAAGFEEQDCSIAQAIMDGVATYNTNLLTEYDNVRFFYTNRISIVSSGALPYIEEIREQFNIEKSDVLYGLFGTLSSTIKLSLEATGRDNTDPLYAVLDKFAADLLEFAEQLESYGTSEDEAIRLQEDIDILFRNFSDGFTDEIAEQAYNLAVDEFVQNRVLIIFDLYEGGNDPDPGPDPGNPGPGTPPDVDIGGNPSYGSEDEIFNPVTGEYVKYSELLQEYYNLLDQIIKSGQLTPEQEHAARVYFELLFNGFDD
ncbi:MAG: hypothetical protein J1G07_01595 [Clostridiales bacterium]|nr:hypothetical protein [Clostridiales bacterium]